MTDNGTPAWEVTGQTETVEPDANNRFVPGVRVTFRVADGPNGSVFIPATDYTVDKARELIGRQAAIVAGVHQLRG